MSHTYTPDPDGATLEGGITLPDDGDKRTAASVNVPLEQIADVCTRLEQEAVLAGASGVNAHAVSFQAGALHGLRHRVRNLAITAASTGNLDSGGVSGTPTEPAYDVYIITGDLTEDGPVNLRMNIVSANAVNQRGRKVLVVRRTGESGSNLGEPLEDAVISLAYTVDGGSPVVVARLGLQPADELTEIGATIGVCWGWVELTFQPSDNRWVASAWGGGGRPVYP